MKKKEREHLKEDPFKLFIANALETIKESKKLFISGAVILLVLIIAVIAFIQIKDAKANRNNEVFLDVLSIVNSNDPLETKIDKLSKTDSDSGISAISKLNLASLHFKNKAYDKALDVLASMSGNAIQLINEKKELMKADIYIATQKNKDASIILQNMIDDSESEMPKDFLMLKLAKVQIGMKETAKAKETLNKLIKDFPQSVYVNQYAARFGYGMSGAGEARQLLNELEPKK